jgi:hypothetical protein
LNIALAVLRGARGRLRREQSRDRRPRRRLSHPQNGLRAAPSGMRPIVHVESRPQRAVPAAFRSVPKRCRETHSTTLARIFIVPILGGELLSIPLRKSAKSADWSSTPWLSLAGCRCLHGLAKLMDMPITFDTAITQHITATRRLQSVSLQMATGKREMGGTQLDPANFSMASKFDAQVHLMEGVPSNAVKEGMSQVSNDRAKVGAAQASLEAESERLSLLTSRLIPRLRCISPFDFS